MSAIEPMQEPMTAEITGVAGSYVTGAPGHPAFTHATSNTGATSKKVTPKTVTLVKLLVTVIFPRICSTAL